MVWKFFNIYVGKIKLKKFGQEHNLQLSVYRYCYSDMNSGILLLSRNT